MGNRNQFALVSSQKLAKAKWQLSVDEAYAACEVEGEPFRTPEHNELNAAVGYFHEAADILAASPEVNDPEQVRRFMNEIVWLDGQYWARAYHDASETPGLKVGEYTERALHLHHRYFLGAALNLYQETPDRSYLEYQLGNYIKEAKFQTDRNIHAYMDTALYNALTTVTPNLGARSKAATLASGMLVEVALRTNQLHDPHCAAIILDAASKKSITYAVAATIERDQIGRKAFSVVAGTTVKVPEWREMMNEIQSVGHLAYYSPYYDDYSDMRRLKAAIVEIGRFGKANDPVVAKDVRDSFRIICSNMAAQDTAREKPQNSIAERAQKSARHALELWSAAPAGTYLQQELGKVWIEKAVAVRKDPYSSNTAYAVEMQRAAWKDIKARSAEAVLNAEFMETAEKDFPGGRVNAWYSMYAKVPKSHPLFKAAQYVCKPEEVMPVRQTLQLVTQGNDLR